MKSIRDTRSLPTNTALKPTAMSLQGLINHVFRERRALVFHGFCLEFSVWIVCLSDIGAGHTTGDMNSC